MLLIGLLLILNSRDMFIEDMHMVVMPATRLVFYAQRKDKEALEKVGGVEGLANALKVDLEHGLQPDAVGDISIERRQQLYGANRFAEVPLKSFFALLRDNLTDKILILLMVAATVCAAPSSCLSDIPPILPPIPCTCWMRKIHGLATVASIFCQGCMHATFRWSALQVSTVLGAALEEERKQNGWTEGVAIWIAVIVVSLVGECGEVPQLGVPDAWPLDTLSAG
jgi:Ca2+-transporting ATPase